MNRKKSADILWKVILLVSLIGFTSNFILPFKFVGNVTSKVFVVLLLFIPYLKRPNIWARIIIVFNFGYIISVFINNFFEVNHLITGIFIFICTLLAIGIFFINFLFPNFLTGEKKPKNNNDEEFILPPKPYTRHPIRSIIVYFLSQFILPLLNPFQLYQTVLHLYGNTIAKSKEKKKNCSPDHFKQEVEYHLPFLGEWIVVNGGISKEDSHSWEIINQRYAYDFVKIGLDKSSHLGSGENLDDYYCYGKTILAPADGEVVDVKTNIRDAKKPGSMQMDFLAKDFRGNYVVIKHAQKEYSFMAHFIPDSIIVKKGQYVKRHEPIGRCGNSGYSTQPHLHFHLQDHPNMFLAIGLPIKFSNLEINGKTHKQSYIKKEQMVKDLSSSICEPTKE